MYKLTVKDKLGAVCASFLADCRERCVVDAMIAHSASQFIWEWA